MRKIKVGINGMGRIGRTVLRAWLDGSYKSLDIVAVNNPGVRDHYTHLLKYDSVHGVLREDVSLNEDILSVGKRKITFHNQKDPGEIDWSSQGVDLVIDGTGVFKTKATLSKHLGGTVKKVIMCAPGKDLDGTFVFGINHEDYNTDTDHVVSNASCTTNCLAPVAKVLHEGFGIENGFMTTVHAYTGDQNLLDASHRDMRRARAAALSMVPTSTGAAKSIGLVIPELKGKLDGISIRVPTPDVSIVDLTVNLEKETTKEEINNAIAEAAKGPLKGVLAYTDEELVSQDFRGRTESAIFDAPLTNVIGNIAKVAIWYDNEVGFSCRVLDLAAHIGAKL